MKQKWPYSEIALAAEVIDWLRQQHWEIYQEVPCGSGSIDIVATRGVTVWAIECKCALGLPVIEQAYNSLGKAHFVSVATPYIGHASPYIKNCTTEILQSLGIGAIGVKEPEGRYPGAAAWEARNVKEWLPARLHRRAKVEKLRNCLCEELKTYAAAGSQSVQRWTPFKETSKQVLGAVRASPGISLKECIDTVKHHYMSHTSARGAVKKSIEQGWIPGVQIVKDGRQIKLYPQDMNQ